MSTAAAGQHSAKFKDLCREDKAKLQTLVSELVGLKKERELQASQSETELSRHKVEIDHMREDNRKLIEQLKKYMLLVTQMSGSSALEGTNPPALEPLSSPLHVSQLQGRSVGTLTDCNASAMRAASVQTDASDQQQLLVSSVSDICADHPVSLLSTERLPPRKVLRCAKISRSPKACAAPRCSSTRSPKRVMSPLAPHMADAEGSATESRYFDELKQIKEQVRALARASLMSQQTASEYLLESEPQNSLASTAKVVATEPMYTASPSVQSSQGPPLRNLSASAGTTSVPVVPNSGPASLRVPPIENVIGRSVGPSMLLTSGQRIESIRIPVSATEATGLPGESTYISSIMGGETSMISDAYIPIAANIIDEIQSTLPSLTKIFGPASDGLLSTQPTATVEIKPLINDPANAPAAPPASYLGAVAVRQEVGKVSVPDNSSNDYTRFEAPVAPANTTMSAMSYLCNPAYPPSNALAGVSGEAAQHAIPALSGQHAPLSSTAAMHTNARTIHHIVPTESGSPHYPVQHTTRPRAMQYTEPADCTSINPVDSLKSQHTNPENDIMLSLSENQLALTKRGTHEENIRAVDLELVEPPASFEIMGQRDTSPNPRDNAPCAAPQDAAARSTRPGPLKVNYSGAKSAIEKYRDKAVHEDLQARRRKNDIMDFVMPTGIMVSGARLPSNSMDSPSPSPNGSHQRLRGSAGAHSSKPRKSYIITGGSVRRASSKTGSPASSTVSEEDRGSQKPAVDLRRDKSAEKILAARRESKSSPTSLTDVSPTPEIVSSLRGSRTDADRRISAAAYGSGIRMRNSNSTTSKSPTPESETSGEMSKLVDSKYRRPVSAASANKPTLSGKDRILESAKRSLNKSLGGRPARASSSLLQTSPNTSKSSKVEIVRASMESRNGGRKSDSMPAHTEDSKAKSKLNYTSDFKNHGSPADAGSVDSGAHEEADSQGLVSSNSRSENSNDVRKDTEMLTLLKILNSP